MGPSNDEQFRAANVSKQSARPRRAVGIVGKSKATTETTVEVDSTSKGIFGMRANAYWESMGVIPLFFAGFGVVALAIKMLKVKTGELRSGPSGINKVTIPKTVITSEEEEAELHVYKCGGCGYEIYPARGREFKFFPDSFKCPLCGTPKSGFWDLNDPDDPRNQEEEDSGNGTDGDAVPAPDDDTAANEPTLGNSRETLDGSDGAESTTTNLSEADTSA